MTRSSAAKIGGLSTRVDSVVDNRFRNSHWKPEFPASDRAIFRLSRGPFDDRLMRRKALKNRLARLVDKCIKSWKKFAGAPPD
jgi:hypothetical protein